MHQFIGSVLPRLAAFDLWELTRRFSGVVAIVVLGVVLATLATRAETPSSGSVVASIAPKLVSPPYSAPTPHTAISMVPSQAKDIWVTVTYYLYATDAQYQHVLAWESQTEPEILQAPDSPEHRYYTLRATTPEEEAIARDTIFTALLANVSHTRILVQDIRNQ